MEQGKLKLSIYSPERRLLHEAGAEWVTLPTSEGQVQVFPGHVAMAGRLETGVFRYQPSHGAQEEAGFLATGFFQVKEDAVVLMAETLELRGEIDLNRAKTAQAKAEKVLQSADLDPAAFRKYQLKLQRALIRQQFGG